MRCSNQDDEKLKELIPDIDQESIPYGYYGCDIRDVQQQTENLRKAVKVMTKYLSSRTNENVFMMVAALETITGKKYEEIC